MNSVFMQHYALKKYGKTICFVGFCHLKSAISKTISKYLKTAPKSHLVFVQTCVLLKRFETCLIKKYVFFRDKCILFAFRLNSMKKQGFHGSKSLSFRIVLFFLQLRKKRFFCSERLKKASFNHLKLNLQLENYPEVPIFFYPRE